MKLHNRLLALVFVIAAPASGLAADVPDGAASWVEESNRNATVLLEVLARYSPESAGSLGVEGADTEVADLKPGYVERTEADVEAAVAELTRRLAAEDDPRVRQDLEILVEAGRDNVTGSRLFRRHLLPYVNVPRTVFFGMQALLDPQLPKDKHEAALVRLRRYVGMEEGYEPILSLGRARMEEQFSAQGLLGPYRGQVEQDLANAPRFAAGIGELFRTLEVEGYEEALAEYQKQLDDWQAWVKSDLMPRARADFPLPPELYEWNLRQFGVEADPEELIDDATRAFIEIRNEMKAIAPLVAQERGWDETDYRKVLVRLRGEQLDGEEILPWYDDVLEQLEGVIREQGVVSLPDRDAIIRLGTEAENSAQPAPHLRPPRLIGNTGQRPEFVLPLANPAAEAAGEGRMDDFTHRAAAWTLTVHEARPGHELQYSSMIENGVSVARAVFAFNSVNVEGWALYAEAEMKPYLPMDGQLVSLQHRLLRSARAFLDPMANLGRIGYDEVRQFLEGEVGLSPSMSRQEADRYTFRAPGQATSYFYGYQKLLALRAATELALGEGFDRKAFHDFVLAQGLLPPALMRAAVMDEFVGAESGIAARPARH